MSILVAGDNPVRTCFTRSAIALSCIVAGCYQSKRPASHERVSVETAEPEVLLSRLCSAATNQPLCKDAMQAAAFSMLVRTARSFEPDPLFSSPDDFLDFVEGKGSTYAMLLSSLGRDSPLFAWVPVNLSSELHAQLASLFFA